MSDENPIFGPIETVPSTSEENPLFGPPTHAVEIGKLYQIGVARGMVIEPGKLWVANVGTDGGIALIHISPVDLCGMIGWQATKDYRGETDLNIVLSPYAALYLVLAGILLPYVGQVKASDDTYSWDLQNIPIESLMMRRVRILAFNTTSPNTHPPFTFRLFNDFEWENF